MNVNTWILAGRLTRDPVLKFDGKLCEFSVATNHSYKKDDEWVEEATYVDCKAHGKTATAIAEYFAKGRTIFVEGSARLETWEAKEGQKRSKIVCNVGRFEFVGPKPQDGDGPDEHSRDPDFEDVGF